MRVLRSYRVSEEVDVLLKAESARLTEETGKKVSEADVIELAMVKWCDVGSADAVVESENRSAVVDRRAIAETAMHEAESKSAGTPPTTKLNPRAESVTQRKARETKEHATALAESDVLAKLTDRSDIEYDLENVPHRSVASMAIQSRDTQAEKPRYEIQPRNAKPLTRPHGATEPKRRREQ